MCVCKKGYWPNDEGTMCNQKSNEVWDFNKCVDVNPDVIDVVCPADKCGENEVCKIIQVRNHFAKKISIFNNILRSAIFLHQNVFALKDLNSTKQQVPVLEKTMANVPKTLIVIWITTKNAINLEPNDVSAETVLFAKKESAQQLAAHTIHLISKLRRVLNI